MPESDSKQNELFKNKIFESLRLLYQPILAELQVAEKGVLGGITFSNLAYSKSQFDYIIRNINKHEKYLITVEYYNKVGDILYYRNGFVLGKKDKESLLCQMTTEYTKHGVVEDDYTKTAFKSPIDALEHYLKGLAIVLDLLERTATGSQAPTNEDESEFLVRKHFIRTVTKVYNVLRKFTSKTENYRFSGSEFYRPFGNTLSDIGDTLICFARKEDKIKKENLENIIEDLLFKPDKRYNPESPNYTHKFFIEEKEIELSFLEKAIVYFVLASLAFRRANYKKEEAFQLTKILNIIKVYAENLISKESNLLDEAVLNNLMKRILEVTHHSMENISIPLGQKYKETFHIELFEKNPIDYNLFLNLEATHADVREVIVIYAEIQFKRYESLFKIEKINELYKNIVISPYANVNKQYNRILELNLKAHLNHYYYEFLGYKEWIVRRENDFFYEKKTRPSQKEIDQITEIFGKNDLDTHIFLVTDTICCLLKVIETTNIFGISYVINHTLLASSHQKLAYWCHELKKLKYAKSKEDEAFKIKKDKKLQDALSFINEGDKSNTSFNKQNHLELAIANYHSCIQMHNKGKAYKDNLNNHHYLDDDFNDNLGHFLVAIERYEINTGAVHEKIKECINQYSKTSTPSKKNKLYDVESYIKQS